MIPTILLQLIHESQDPGGSWDRIQFVPGWQQEAFLGDHVALVGDMDHDGAADYIVSAKLEDYQGTENAGAAHLVSGRSGQLIRSHFGQDLFDLLGWSVYRIGDTNGDGIPEYGVTNQPNSMLPVGDIHAFIYDGAAGVVLVTIPIPVGHRSFGTDATGVGDWNSDGYPDVSISDYWQTVNGQSQVGAVYIFSGTDGSEIQKIVGDAAGHALGSKLAGGGDADGDGVQDLLVRNDWDSGNSIDVLEGGTGRRLYRISSLTGIGFLGVGMDFVPDLDGDGCDEILAGAPNIGTTGHGEAYLFSGRTGSLIYRWYGEEFQYSRDFGESVACTGDLNLDGIPDWTIGAPYINVTPGQGKVYFYSGADGHLLHTITDDPLAVGGLGYELDGGMDVNGDGRSDVLLPMPRYYANGVPAIGAVSVFSFDPFLKVSEPTLSAGAGGTVAFTLDFPIGEGGREYRLLASHDILGDPLRIGRPWMNVHGVKIPLVESQWTHRMWNAPPAAFAGAHGTLDAAGDATVLLTLPPGAAAAAIGHTFRFAAVTLVPGGFAGLSSAAAVLIVTP